MNSRPAPETRLVADIGGTNTRIALYDSERDAFSSLATYINREYPGIEAVIADWLTALDGAAPRTGCIAVAAPPGDRVTMSNLDWSFSCRELAQRFGLQTMGWINDFEGNAYALPHLGPDDRETLRAGRGDPGARLAVVGPGTGLGGATVEYNRGRYQVSDGEPGHMGFSPADDEELALFGLLLGQYRDIYNELLLSGPGLLRLYQALAQLRGLKGEALTPAQVSTAALSGSDPLSVAALERFCAMLGSACGDFVLATGSYGGLYLAGGIAPRILPFLRDSRFLARFGAKGAMREHLSAVPVHVITAPHPGLVGAAHAPLR